MKNSVSNSRTRRSEHSGSAPIVSYADRWSVAPGESVRFMVSTEAPYYDAELVRLIGGGPRRAPEPDALAYTAVDAKGSGRFPGRTQPTQCGSYAVVGDFPDLGMTRGLTLAAWIYPTTPAKGEPQGLLTRWSASGRAGLGLFLDASGAPAFRYVDAGSEVAGVTTGRPLIAARWYLVACAAEFDRGVVTVCQLPLRGPDGGSDAFVQGPLTASASARGAAPILIGGGHLDPAPEGPGRPRLSGGFNGKIERPRIFSRALSEAQIAGLRAEEPLGDLCEHLVADWDFGVGISSMTVTDRSPSRRDGNLVNGPMRAVTGHNWSGESLDYQTAPGEYGAIHFHDDDLDDAGWSPDFELVIPATARSGVYAARLTCEAGEDLVTFVVRPPRTRATAPVAFLAPTLSYAAYSNFETTRVVPEVMTGSAPVYDPVEGYVSAHPELGYSLYNRHGDGSGIAYVSRLRPLMNMRPRYRFWLNNGGGWGVSGDMYLIDWLEAKGFRYDVIADDDVHLEGSALLERYPVVITGAHPEYCTREMLDALERYTATGGRLMYLGGNGFYWVTSIDPERPHVLEVRRGQTGTRAWSSAPGEVHHSTTGEPGGLWRNRGRAPQRLVGVGFCAQGGGGSASYARTPASDDPRASFIFDGIDRGELIGDFGTNMGGAAGDEIDRADHGLGTPSHALVVATSSGRHSDLYQQALEEVAMMLPGRGGTECPDVRADLTYFATAGGGAVFSAGSIAWSASLSHNRYDNNVSRVTENVLRAFNGAGPE